MNTLLDDIRYATRMLIKARGFAVIGVLTLALGIGASTALFSIVNGVLLNPLPYPRAAELVTIYEDAPGISNASMSYLNFLDWQRMSRTFSSMAIYRNQDFSFTGVGQAERVTGFMVSADFFRTLGQTPVLGRDLASDDDRVGARPVVILSGGFWQRRFAGSPSVLNSTITLNGAPYTVVGVVPSAFTFYGQQRDVYTAIGQWNDPSFRDRGIEVSTHAFGRLKTGVTLAQAAADMHVVGRNLAATYPVADKNIGITLVLMKQDIVGNVQPFLLVLLAAVGFLLLLACANVANLLLARSMGRAREFAIRAALGATRTRMIRQLLTESLLLAGLGGLSGLVLAVCGTKVVVNLLPGQLPRAGEVALDGRVLLFAICVSLGAGALFGLAPALKVSRVNLQDVLKESGRGTSGRHSGLQRTFIAVEVALALVLLIGAGLMLRSLQALWRVDPGFVPDHAITFSLSMPSSPNTTSAETRARLRRFDATIQAVSGVDAVSVTLGSRPMIHDTSLPFWIDGREKPANLHDMPQTMCYLVEGGFRQAMGVRLERGRFVTPQDDERSPRVVDIDDAFARTYFPNENPIGKRINLAGFDVQAEIVGVVHHVKQWGPAADPTSAIEAQIYYPFMQLPEKLMPMVADAVAVVLRTKSDPTAVMAAVRRAVADLEPGDVIYRVQTMDDVLASSLAARRLSMMLLSVFAVLALVLACAGIYGVISYLVAQRTQEIGVRMALGAEPGEVMRLILAQGSRMAAIGVAIGSAAALGLTRLMANQLFGVTAHDPLTFAGIAVVLMLVAVAASYVPARRAMRVDPVVALRSE
jgi:predicted permease